MSELLVQVLGTAQDGGYPQPGCNCPNCKKAHKNQHLIRYPASLGIIDSQAHKSYIIDPTPKLPEQLRLLNKKAIEANLSKDHLEGIFITHAHMGHYPGLLYFGKEVMNSSKLKVFCSHKMNEFLSANQPWRNLVENNICVKTFKNEEKIIQDNIIFQPVEVPHRAEHTDTYGFLVRGEKKALFYIPDIDQWEGFEDKFNEITKKVDYMLLDGTFYEREELKTHRDRKIKNVPHPPVKETLSLLEEGTLKKNGAKIFFTHFNHTNRVLHPSFTEDISCLREGQVIKL